MFLHSHYTDSRTRHDRVELQTEQWMLQMDRLVDAYLNYCSHDTGDGLLVPEESEVDAQCLADIELVDLFGKYDLHTWKIVLNKSRSPPCNASIPTMPTLSQ